MRNITDQILDDVKLERIRQDAKWGRPNQTFDRRMTILTEEVGEAAEATLNNDTVNLREELVQIAAVAVATVELLDEQQVW